MTQMSFDALITEPPSPPDPTPSVAFEAPEVVELGRASAAGLPMVRRRNEDWEVVRVTGRHRVLRSMERPHAFVYAPLPSDTLDQLVDWTEDDQREQSETVLKALTAPQMAAPRPTSASYLERAEPYEVPCVTCRKPTLWGRPEAGGAWSIRCEGCR